MPRLNKFQKIKQQERNDYIMELARQGKRMEDIKSSLRKKFGTTITTMRISQIINESE